MFPEKNLIIVVAFTLLSSPAHPDDMKWDELYPNMNDNEVKFLDIGCGYGGFLGEINKNVSARCFI